MAHAIGAFEVLAALHMACKLFIECGSAMRP